MSSTNNLSGIHVGGVDLLDLGNNNIIPSNEDDDFTKWVLSRSTGHKNSLKNQIIELQKKLGDGIFIELLKDIVYVYYREGVTFKIKMAREGTCQSFENYLYFVEKNKLIYSEKTINKDSFLLINFWISFTDNVLKKILKTYTIK